MYEKYVCDIFRHFRFKHKKQNVQDVKEPVQAYLLDSLIKL
jgi:hypothetical protein